MPNTCGETTSWVLRPCPSEKSRKLATELGLSAIVADLLVQRGLTEPEACRRFLQPALTHLVDPLSIHQMDVAVKRISEAIANKERVLIYGDYDVDGVTSTSLMLEFLRLTGLEPQHYIPSRLSEGYSFSQVFLDKLDELGIDLIISVDNGITSLAEIDAISAKNIDVIVTDHHEPLPTLPKALAVVNPKLSPDENGSTQVCGAAVAYKTIWAVASKLSPGKRVTQEFREFLLNALALVGMATICDSVPLQGENRVFAVFGMKALRNTKQNGLKALIQLSCREDRVLDVSDVGFRLGPRINAAGRLKHADIAVDLLTAENFDKALEVAKTLESTNRERKQVELTILEEAEAQIQEQHGGSDQPVFVLAGEDWHSGVVGIVAARIAERHGRPAILIGLNGRNETGRGSARSAQGIHLLDLIRTCESDLIRFGGHAFAAGLEIRADKIDDFRQNLLASARDTLIDVETGPRIDVDLSIDLDQLTFPLLAELELLGPFGKNNPSPVFMAESVEVVGTPRIVGSRHNHLSLMVKQGEKVFRAIGFDLAQHHEGVTSGEPISILFVPVRNLFKGQTFLELQLLDIRVSVPEGIPAASGTL